MPPQHILDSLVRLWRRKVTPALALALMAGVLLGVLLTAHVSRVGTIGARVLGGVLLVTLLIGALTTLVRQRRLARRPKESVERVLVPADPETGKRVLRALNLAEQTRARTDVGSHDLADLHLRRVLSRVSPKTVEGAASRRARSWHFAAMAAGLTSLVVMVIAPLRILEGYDVLMARGGRAPLAIPWLDFTRVQAQPPAYLRARDRVLFPGAVQVLPKGTVLTVRGVPKFDSRHLVLTDGKSEVPFVSDAKGGVVARWTLEESTRLMVGARFGDVLIPGPEPLELESVPDRPPVVELQFRLDQSAKARPAPARLKLADVERLELFYAASDDYGLRQVDVVLTAGDRDQRRTIDRLAGEVRSAQGGHVLLATDAFLRRMFLPVRVTVQARDTDPTEDSKWGISREIVLVPPAVGEREAARYSDLKQGRDELTRLLALRMAHEAVVNRSPKQMGQHRKEDKLAQARAATALRTAADAVHGGLRMPSGARAFILGQARVIDRAVPRGASAVRRSEDVVLAVDSVLRRMGVTDARNVSKQLGDVAEEVAVSARAVLNSEERTRSVQRLDGAVDSLKRGGKSLRQLGTLGADLGSVAKADTGRIERAIKDENWVAVELAARHLAARLRRPNPSFGSKRRGGVESGGSVGQPSGEPSTADDGFNQLAQELDSLARDHAGEISNMERALADGEKAVPMDDLTDEAKQRAEKIRKLLRDLPLSGAEPGSPRARAALGREHGSAMAQSLEQMALRDAVKSGKSAMAALRDARKRAKAAGADLQQQTLKRTEDELMPHVRWAEQQLERLRKGAEARSKQALQGGGDREQELARRAGNLGSRGLVGETALPQDMLENIQRAESLMRDAARELSAGNGKKGIEMQRKAQRWLERSTPGQTESEPQESDTGKSPTGKSSGGKGQMSTEGTVPGGDRKNRAEDFRKRVLRGLGKGSDGKLSPAVRRYAEALLR